MLEGFREEAAPFTLNGALILIDDDRWLYPGEEDAVVIAHPLAPQFWGGVHIGQDMFMCEGARTVGRGSAFGILESAESI